MTTLLKMTADQVCKNAEKLQKYVAKENTRKQSTL